jgi:hypothetical protein
MFTGAIPLADRPGYVSLFSLTAGCFFCLA